MKINPKQTVVINEIETEPLSEYIINFLKSQKKECAYLDFKLIINTDKNSDFPEVVKDILAFSNYGGGWILIGWKEEKKSQYFPVGVPEDYNVDQAILQEKFNSYILNPIELLYKEITEDINGEVKRFAFIYIPPSTEILKPKCDGEYINKKGKQKHVFSADEIFYRRGTQNIHPSDYELKLIEERIKKENYKISILSGEPDEINEDLFGNLFEVKTLPKYVYLGNMLDYDGASIKYILQEEGVTPSFYNKYREWNKKLITFENLQEENNPYSKLVDNSSITRELVSSWFDDPDKSRIMIDLLNRELIHFAISEGFYHDRGKLFYPITDWGDKREQEWQGRYRKSSKVVAAKIYAGQVKRFLYWHAAIAVSFVRIGNKIFLKVIPTFVLTTNGRRTTSGFREGTVITRLSYDMRNSKYLNNILFWINQLKGDKELIKIKDYLEIETDPSKCNIPFGIIFDIPSAEFDIEIEEEGDFIEGEEDDI